MLITCAMDIEVLLLLSHALIWERSNVNPFEQPINGTAFIRSLGILLTNLFIGNLL